MSTPTLIDHPTRIDLLVAVSQITIADIDTHNDEGTYECEVIDGLSSRSSDRIFIEIFGKLLGYLPYYSRCVKLMQCKYLFAVKIFLIFHSDLRVTTELLTSP